MSEITLLLEQAQAGDESAWQRVAALLHDDLLRLARCANTSGRPDTLNAAALVQECYRQVAGSGTEIGIGNRSHFLALAGRAMRQILTGHARERVAAKSATDATPDLAADREADELLSLDAALQQLGASDERAVRVVDCRLFGGLTEVETAEALRLPLRTVQRLWAKARERLQSLQAA